MSDVMKPLTSEAIEALGGVRPMAVASEIVYVFGEWQAGLYPVVLRMSSCRDAFARDVVARWEMRIFGFACIEEPTQGGLTHLLKKLGVAK